MKTTIRLTTLVIGLLVAGPARAAQPAADPSIYSVELRNRRFEPTPGVDSKLRAALQEPAASPVYGAVQFFRFPSQSDRDFLQRAGVTLRQHLGSMMYLANFSRETPIDSLTNAIRWAGFLRPDDRVEKSLWDGKIKASDLADPDRIKLLVEFRDDVRTNEVRAILAKYTPEYRPFGLTGEWAIELPTNAVKTLAAENAIWWIRTGPSGFRPLAAPAKLGP